MSDEIEYVTIVIKLPHALAPNDPWPSTVRDLLTGIGIVRSDGTEVVAFSHSNAMNDGSQK